MLCSLIRTRSCLVHVLASAQAGHDTSAADESRCAGVTGVVPSAPPVVTDTSSVSTVPTKVPVRIEGSGSNMLESASAGIKESASGATDCALLPTSPDSKVNRGDEEDIMHADDVSIQGCGSLVMLMAGSVSRSLDLICESWLSQ